jgi:putative sugar O-methyltransferase
METKPHNIREIIEEEKQSIAYRNYRHVRERVIDMLMGEQSDTKIPSNYWRQEVAGFDYMLDASALITNKLREHCYHISGLRSYEYRSHHEHQKAPFARKLEALRRIDSDNLFVPESQQMGGFGHVIDGNLVNLDTLKFYESLIAMNKGGLLNPLREETGDRKVVVEIGGGWGGFAYQLKTICPGICYVMIDLPQSLIFSAVYLMTLFPGSNVFVYGDKPVEHLVKNFSSYDFVFLPHYFINEATLPRLDVAVNMVSFQEMTEAQINGYIKWLWDSNCPSIYSHNRGKSPHNPEIVSSVPAIIGQGYTVEGIKVLPVPYTVLDLPRKADKLVWDKDPKKMARVVMKRIVTPPEKEREIVITDYRHVMGSRNQSYQLQTMAGEVV